MKALAELSRRRAELLRQLAELDERLARAFEAFEGKPEPEDVTLSLQEASVFLGEPASTVRRRGCYLRARVSTEGERRLRYSRRVLEEIRQDRLAAAEMRW